MRKPLSLAVLSAVFLSVVESPGAESRVPAFYGDPPDETHAWCVHDRNRPLPPLVQPGDAPGKPPSDAVVLFDGKSLDSWVSVSKTGEVTPAKWALKEGAMEVVPKSGIVRTKQQFADCQLHIEWATPKEVVGDSQGRGNSGIFLCGKYEVQVLDSFNNITYADGQAASVYAQNPPLANVSRGPGEWQAYDIVFHPTRFDAAGKVVSPGTVTVIQNGVLMQDNWEFEGLAGHRARPKLAAHPEKGPLELQDHGNPMRFRNIWIREIPPRVKPTPEQVATQRKETAAKLRKEAGSSKDTLAEMKLWMESLVYADDATAAEKARKMSADYADSVVKLEGEALKAREGEILEVRGALKFVNEHKLATPAFDAQQKIEGFLKSKGVKFK